MKPHLNVHRGRWGEVRLRDMVETIERAGDEIEAPEMANPGRFRSPEEVSVMARVEVITPHHLRLPIRPTVLLPAAVAGLSCSVLLPSD